MSFLTKGGRAAARPPSLVSMNRYGLNPGGAIMVL